MQLMTLNFSHTSIIGGNPGEGTAILGHGWEVLQWWPLFLRFFIRISPYFMPHHDLIDPSFCKKKPLLRQKIWFLIKLTPFSLILDLFDPSFLQNLRSYQIHFFVSPAEPSYQTFGEVPRGGCDFGRIWRLQKTSNWCVVSIEQLYAGRVWHGRVQIKSVVSVCDSHYLFTNCQLSRADKHPLAYCSLHRWHTKDGHHKAWLADQ